MPSETGQREVQVAGAELIELFLLRGNRGGVAVILRGDQFADHARLRVDDQPARL